MTDFDPSAYLPFDSDAYAVTPQKDEPTPYGAFAYIGQALTLEAFTAYVNTYNFGSIPPDYNILHHTAIPSTLYARYSTGAIWDANEAGMNDAQIQAKRKRQLDNIMIFYRDTRGWGAGPHLFCDEKWVWLFTPMNTVGVHAAAGNSYRDNSGHLHYSIGIEVVGYYEHVTWPDAVARNVAGAVAALHTRLGTFAYIPMMWAGGISGHRDYGKPACPGAAITPDYYMLILKAGGAAQRYRAIGLPVYQRSDRTGPLWGHLQPGQIVTIDDPSNGHIASLDGVPAGIGFVDMNGLEPI